MVKTLKCDLGDLPLTQISCVISDKLLNRMVSSITICLTPFPPTPAQNRTMQAYLRDIVRKNSLMSVKHSIYGDGGFASL